MGVINKLLFGIFSIALILSTHVSQARPNKEPHHQDFIDEHNRARAEVGVGPIKWNDTVAAYAQKYADSKIETCEMVHSQGPYGENLAEGYGEMTGGQAVKFWVTEKPNYDYASNTCVGDVCGHYTQVVWRNSTHVGCARAKCKNGWMFVICSYYPPGNYIGERPY
ncbi:PREDICTED: basic form of pathogenesis-related protein 1-like [Prunus mume]|uniref:Basic form of pathogenesis-related protein 1-like n=1 Tax=Prunus mume TaxID=102107 RepID=A0ABM0P9D6_PRUMU|nr:PREDICTED: basic form of pathogenesis-related protein 1-like [Prunus mume]